MQGCPEHRCTAASAASTSEAMSHRAEHSPPSPLPLPLLPWPGLRLALVPGEGEEQWERLDLVALQRVQDREVGKRVGMLWVTHKGAPWSPWGHKEEARTAGTASAW